jgi:FkbM family methyltransferase
MKIANLKKNLANRFGENLLLGIILLFNSKNWVYKFVPANTHYKTGTLRNVKRKGNRYILDLSDYQEWLLYFYCKSDSSDHILDYLEKAEVIFDIGANIGQTSLNITQTQKKKGLNPVIYAFEPYPRTYHKLKTNVDLNASSDILAYNLGLSTEKGILHMIQHSPSNSGGFRMTNNPTNSVAVPVISLDEFVSENHLMKVDFIKIDVEGFELQVLKGAQETLKRFKPILVFEYSVKNILAQNGDIADALNRLLEMNYLLMTKEGLSNLESILKLDYQTDLICIPN